MVQCNLPVARQIIGARAAQERWADIPVRQRLRFIRRVRTVIAKRSNHLASAAAPDRIEEALASQVLPLADACKFLERNAERILRTRKLGRKGRPLWLSRIDSRISREPLGIVLIVGPSNYPLFLPGVQSLQALAAGNAVLLKPGRQGERAAEAFAAVVREAGIDPRLITVLPATDDAGEQALDLPIQKVFFTGSTESGYEVLTRLGSRGIPAVVELSGCDAVFVREDADLELVMRALLFGLRFNGSATCIAPRRIFVARRLAERLEAALASAVSATRCGDEYEALTATLADALTNGATALVGGVDTLDGLYLPCILTDVQPSMRIMQIDTLAPLLSIVPTDSDDHALSLAAQCPYALGVTIFSRDETAARKLAARVCAGVVTINDLIIPTADPRVPFGGRQRSGYGVTRGAEGLLEMTTSKVVQFRGGNFRPHFDPARPYDRQLFGSYIVAAHAVGLTARAQAACRVLRTLLQRNMTRRPHL